METHESKSKTGLAVADADVSPQPQRGLTRHLLTTSDYGCERLHLINAKITIQVK